VSLHDSLAVVLGLVFAAGGVLKLVGRGPAAELGSRLGLSPALLHFIGVCELGGGVGLLVGAAGWTALGALAAAGLTLLTLSGVVAHLRAREPVSAMLPAVVLGAGSAYLLAGFLGG